MKRKRWSSRNKEYAAFIASAEWGKIRKAALGRAKHQCERCGDGQKQLHVHHVSYKRFGGQEVPSDLEVLCISCHRQAHGRLFGGPKKAPRRKKSQVEVVALEQSARRKADLKRKLHARSRLLKNPNR